MSPLIENLQVLDNTPVSLREPCHDEIAEDLRQYITGYERAYTTIVEHHGNIPEGLAEELLALNVGVWGTPGKSDWGFLAHNKRYYDLLEKTNWYVEWLKRGITPGNLKLG